MKISVIVPIFKVEKYLDQCVESIVKQTYKDLEIILVDDGSPDSCPEICDNWAKKDNRIKVLHKKNGGLSSARNAGLKIAQGDYVSFIDSDDFISEDMFVDLLRVMKSDKRNVIASSPLYNYVDGDISLYQHGTYTYKDGDSFSLERFLRLFLSGNIDVTVTNKLYKREFILVPFTEGKNNEDFLFLYDNVKANYSKDILMVVSGTPHYYYRYNEQSISHQDKNSINRLFFDEIRNIRYVRNDLKSWNKSAEKLLIPIEEGFLIHACDQIIKFPILKEKRKEDCLFIKSELKQAGILRRGRTLSATTKLFLFRFMPSFYLLASKIKNQL